MSEHNYIQNNNDHDGIDRRGFLKCMAWAGTGVLWTVSGGLLTSRVFADLLPSSEGGAASRPAMADFSFVQISDSHIGFSKDPNHDVTATLRVAIERINALADRPELLIHTGDITHLSKPEEFDTCAEALKS